MEGTTWQEAFSQLSPAVRAAVRVDEPLRGYTTLRVGGPADYFVNATETDTLAEVAALGQCLNLPLFLLGEGSYVCIGDAGVRGIVLHNGCRRVRVGGALAACAT